MNVSPFYKLEIFIPAENVVNCWNTASVLAGEIGKYDHCSSITQVLGTYPP